MNQIARPRNSNRSNRSYCPDRPADSTACLNLPLRAVAPARDAARPSVASPRNRRFERPAAAVASAVVMAGWAALAIVAGSIARAAEAIVPADFAAEVTRYEPGTGFAVDFQSGAGYTNTVAVLGAPSREIPGDFGGPVHPMNPPYLGTQLLSIGDGGSLTVRFDRPIYNHPDNPFGLDFLVYGGAGFVITNNNFEGGGITDGSLFGVPTGTTRVSVSDDGQTYFLLDAGRAPDLDGAYPTDGGGTFGVPVDPALNPEAFSGADIGAIRSLYGGSAGGAGFDLDWALDPDGNPAPVSRIQYVRIEFDGDHLELDGFAIVSPPGRWVERFDSDPTRSGWRAHGRESVFAWSESDQALQVAWNTEIENSFFHRSLGTVVTRADDFEFSFDLTLESLNVDFNGGYAFELAVGLIRTGDAFSPEFRRGTGMDAVNLVEWDYFPDTGFGATLSPAIISDNGRFAVSFNFPLELTLTDRFTVSMRYRSDDATLATTMLRNGEPFADIKPVTLPASFTDFAVDAFSVSSYADHDDRGSILAQGTIDNVIVAVPPPPIRGMQGTLTPDGWSSTLVGRDGWTYQLERSGQLTDWTPAGLEIQGSDGMLTLVDPDPPATGNAFYRVRANRNP